MTDIEQKENKIRVSFKDVTRFTLHFWRPRWHTGTASAALMLAAVLMDAVVPVYTGKIVDAMTKNAPGSVVAWEAAWHAFWLFVFFGSMHQILRFVAMLFWNKFAVGNLYDIVNMGLQRVQRFSSDWHANSFAGGTVRKITRGMWAFDMFEDTLLMGILQAVTIMIGMTVMLTMRLPAVGLSAAALIVAYCGASAWMALKILQPRFADSADADTKIGATLADIITSNATVKAFGTEAREDALFRTVADTWSKKAYRAWQAGQGADGVRSIFRLLMMVGMVALTIMMWHDGRATAGDIVLVITSFFIIGGYLRDIGMHLAHLQRSVNDMEDVVHFWLRAEDVADMAMAEPIVVMPSARADMISFDQVKFTYPGTGKVIYDNLSVNIRGGERLALVGPSGSGKSTFVKLIQRLYNIDGGVISIDGRNIAGATMESLRRQIALVPQDPALFHRSLSENIAYGNPSATMEEIVAAAKKAFAHDFIMALPKGYDTLVGERGVKLSGGERQRVAIARAILADAPVLILDEATSSLDSISEHYIQKALDTLMEGRTTITIAHRLSTIQKADRILVFDQGRIIEQGSHAELMLRPNSRYKALYDMQALDLVRDAA